MRVARLSNPGARQTGDDQPLTARTAVLLRQTFDQHTNLRNRVRKRDVGNAVIFIAPQRRKRARVHLGQNRIGVLAKVSSSSMAMKCWRVMDAAEPRSSPSAIAAAG